MSNPTPDPINRTDTDWTAIVSAILLVLMLFVFAGAWLQ